MDGGITHALSLGRVQVMVDGGQYHVVADEGAFVDGDPALVLELAAHVDEHPFAHDGVLAAIGMERRKEAHRPRDFASPELF